MSEEEKKAIEWLKKADWFSARKYAPSILQLIDKQQKEIEELKRENFDTVYIQAIADFKDKIRENIKELEGQEDWYIENKSLDDLYGRIDELKQLLED